jgi:hypothetical protein
MASLHLALVHHPTTDKQGDCVATSVTNLDVHDLSRAGRTYGVEGFWVVHPYPAMKRYVEHVLSHWQEGWGAAYNPTRREALHVTRPVTDLGSLATELESLYPGREVVWVATSAKVCGRQLQYETLRGWLHDSADPRLFCMLLGTGWGLHDDVIADMDYVLEPLKGPGPWNHLSVRAAGGIILDRLMGLR